MGHTAGQRTDSLREQGSSQRGADAAMYSRWITSACARGLRVPMLVCALSVLVLLGAASTARAADRDRDGLRDRVERHQHHTNPRKADTDGDRLRDKFELRRSHTSPRRKDTDRDGLSDGFEVKEAKTSPRRKDTDGDGLSDRYELKRSKSSPRREDTDGDGLSDGYEVKNSNTSPRRADDDGDGLADGVEVLFGLDPNTGPGDDPPAPDPPADDPPPPGDPSPPDDPGPSDEVAPDTSLGTGGPHGTAITGTATFTFSSSEPGSTFECRLDAGVWSACASPKGYTGLREGQHNFYVRARDAAGNSDASPAQRTWTVDLPPLPDIIPPNTSLGTGGPHGTVTTGSASFTFSSSESGSTFQCRLDSGLWGACSSPKSYSGLGEGQHNFYVRARDAAGNFDPVPAQRTWTVDFPAPPPSATATATATAASAGTGRRVRLGIGERLEWLHVRGTLPDARARLRGRRSGGRRGGRRGLVPVADRAGRVEGGRLQGHRAAEAPPARQRGLERRVRRLRRGRGLRQGSGLPQQR